MDQRLTETEDQCRVLQSQVESYRTLAIRCNNRMDEYETVLQQHTNALRDLKEQPITCKMDDSVSNSITTNKFNVHDTKSKSSVTTSSISTSGRSSSMPNIKVPTALSDKLSVAGDNAMSPTKTIYPL